MRVLAGRGQDLTSLSSCDDYRSGHVFNRFILKYICNNCIALANKQKKTFLFDNGLCWLLHFQHYLGAHTYVQSVNAANRNGMFVTVDSREGMLRID